METISSRKFFQTFLWVTIATGLFAAIQTVQRSAELEIILWRSKWVFLTGVFALNIVIGLFMVRYLSTSASGGILERLESFSAHRFFGFLLVIFGVFLPWVFRLYIFGDILPQGMPILWIFLWAALLQTVGLRWWTGRSWHILFAAVILTQGLAYHFYGQFTSVTEYPFSIGYSEASRHYYASTIFAQKLYGIELPFPFLHPTRYFLLSIPFFVDGLPLWFHRLWQSLLWLGLTSASSILLARRLKLHGWMLFLFSAWVFLFFMQGAVYYHLQVSVILILAGISMDRPVRSFVFVLLASIWAGASRVNWFPVPAMLAIVIYILETPNPVRGLRYWVTPFLWGLFGLVFAVGSQFAYISISGNADARAFGSSFSSDLLWNRLFPNETTPLGILPAILIVSLPLFTALWQMLRGKLFNLYFLRWVVPLLALLVLFLGGLAVSTKIGGGGDLHNMDAYLVMLALISGYFFAGRVAADADLPQGWGRIDWTVMAAVIIIPIYFALPRIGFMFNYDRAGVDRDVEKLQQVVTESVANGGEVLFVTERQLLTFDILHGIPLTSDYEQVELMEMAMSGNQEYLETFYTDLKNRRFSLIIAEDQKYVMRKEGAFTEEDNAWVKFVGVPLLCEYKTLDTLSSVNIQIFVPRPNQHECKDPFAD